MPGIGRNVCAVDDGSTDATAVILADFAARDAQLVVISQPNGGVSTALTYYRKVPTSTMNRPLPVEYYDRMRFVLEYMIAVHGDSPGELDLFCGGHLIGFLRQFRKYLRRALLTGGARPCGECRRTHR